MLRRSSICGNTLLVRCAWCAILVAIIISAGAVSVNAEVVKREERRTLVSTEYGEISAARVSDNINASYLLHFFTLELNSLLLPLILHSDMVFYVHTGSGRLSWTEEDDLKSAELRRGDVYRVEEGAVFFVESNLETERQKLRINALFANSNNGLNEPVTGPYSSIRDMLLGFDRRVLQAAFNVPDEVMDEMLNGTKPPEIIHGLQKSKRTNSWQLEARGLLTSYNILESNKKKKKSSAKLFNLFKEAKDFENCNGWSTTVTRKKLSALKGSDIGLFMVNLTSGSMMGPHWNPVAAEVAVVLQGRGMVRVVCSSISNETGCTNTRFEVGEGDVFVVPRFHPMAQMSFNNETLVFMGFSSSAKKNHPQFLAGQASVFRTLDRDVLALSFNVSNTTLDQLVAPQRDSVILGCVSCAEEELRLMEEEIEKEREEAKAKEEEAERKREEERRKEEEEARKREEEEAKKEEEERQRREEEEAAAKRREEEEERKKQEEEAAQREEEERQKREEEEAAAAKRREEKEERKRQEEEARRREEEEEERKKQEEEAARREEEERQEREEEEAAARRREEEEAREAEEERQRREEEAAGQEEEERQRREEEEAAARRAEEKQRQREEKEAAARRAEEKQRQREEEEAEARRREEEEQRQREEEEAAARMAEEKQRQREEEEAAARRAEEKQRHREEEEAEARRREEEEQRQKEEEEAEARRREEEEQRQREGEQEEEEATRRQREQEKEEGRSEGERAAEEERRREEEAQREEERGGGGGGGRGEGGERIVKKRWNV